MSLGGKSLTTPCINYKVVKAKKKKRAQTFFNLHILFQSSIEKIPLLMLCNIIYLSLLTALCIMYGYVCNYPILRAYSLVTRRSTSMRFFAAGENPHDNISKIAQLNTNLLQASVSGLFAPRIPTLKFEPRSPRP